MALGISMAGAAGTMGLAQTGFWGGMLHNGFLAATIGGLADWFAVTALFRKPLGISYRTEIIVRNRQRIMQAVTDFAANDLLGAENIMKFVRQQDLSKLLQDFILGSGREKILPYTENIGKLLEQQLDTAELAHAAAPIVKQALSPKRIQSLVTDSLHTLAREENTEQLVHILAVLAEELLQDEKLKAMTAEYLERTLQEYGEGSTSRSFVLGLLGLSGEMAADTLWKRAKQYIDEIGTSSMAEKAAAEHLSSLLEQLAGNESVQSKLAELLDNRFSEQRVAELLADWLNEYLAEGKLSAQLRAEANELMERLLADKEWQQRADEMLKNWLAEEIKSHHTVITGMIEERLNRFSDADLVRFTEEKVADDLQMIRINGSVVGSLVGMGLYVIAYAARQVLAP